MADETSVAAGKRFSRDLRRIREDRDVSIDEIHKETRIARSLIESFEEGGLYDHETFNEVYLRSFVRAYAEAVGISPETVRTELKSALEGTYENALAEAYLSEPPPTEEGEDEAATEDTEPERPSAPPSTADDSDVSTPDPPSAGGPEGRGGIVGPARALGAEPEGEADAPEDSSAAAEDRDPDAETDAAPDVTRSEEPEGEESGPASASPPLDDASGANVSDPESDFPAVEGSSAEDEPPAEKESSPDEEAPVAEEPPGEDEASVTEGPSIEDADDEFRGLSDDRRPSWMDEGEEADAPDSSQPGESDARATPGEGGAAPPPAGGGGGTGIVGEPTALGSESEAPETPSTPSTPRPSQKRDRGTRSAWRRLLGGEKRELVWAGVGFVVVLLVLVGLGVAFFSADSTSAPEEATTASTAPPTDTAATAPADTAETSSTAEDRPPPADVTLGPSISLTLLATQDVRGIRIERDEDLERPYWIEEGDAAVFPFEERVTLQNELGHVEPFVAGYPYPESQWDTTGQIVITRTDVEAFVDTLRGAPATLTTTPDTIPKGPPDQ